HPKVGKTRVVGPVAKLSKTPGTIRSPAPSLGEHTEEVLRDLLHLSPDNIDQLIKAGVITRRT
ncbi:MAG: CoA transferase, partial [Betaproteobacteria bacterium]